MSQSEHEGKTCSRHGKTFAFAVIGREYGARFLIYQCKTKAISKLLSTRNWKPLYPLNNSIGFGGTLLMNSDFNKLKTCTPPLHRVISCNEICSAFFKRNVFWSLTELKVHFFSPLPDNLYLAMANNRSSAIQCQVALRSLSSVCRNWSSFVLLENNSYVKFI